VKKSLVPFESKNLSIIPIHFWGLVCLIWLINIYSIAIGGFVTYILSSLYLKYQFEQINDQIEKNIKWGSVRKLMIAMSNHNSLTQSTIKLNLLFKYILFIIYYLAKPTLNLILYLTHGRDSSTILRIAAMIAFSFLISLIYSVNYFSTAVTKAAHKSYQLFFQFLIKRRLNIRDRLKILAFIEKLSGPNIGFYCYDLFPMNNYEFYQYIANWFSNYFLIIGLVILWLNFVFFKPTQFMMA